MNIALITNKKLHHKYWVSELYKDFDIKLIIHPNSKSKNIKSKIFGSGNFVWSLLKLSSIFYNKFSKKSYSKQLQKGEIKYFKDFESIYDKINKSRVHHVDSVNSSETIQLIKSNEIDIVCFLGGDIVKKDFFQQLDVICLNYHSGISPFYNGNKTIFHAVADFRPNFAGGTLMIMNEKIDGGAILSHYLVSIDKNDTAADLFLKGIKGAVLLYKDSLNQNKIEDLKGVSQERSFKYVRNLDWTFLNDIRLNMFYKSGKMKIYERDEQILTYYNNSGLEEVYISLLLKILGKANKW